MLSWRRAHLWSWCLVAGVSASVAWSMCGPAVAAEGGTVSGTLKANGKTVALPYVYAYALDKGFYDESDPAWKLIFVEHPIAERDVDEHIWDAAYVELAITKTAEFGDKPEYQVYSQNIRFSADSGGNVSGGEYPKLELKSAGPDRLAGRVYHTEEQTVFDDKFQYDFTFSAPLSNPNAPLGEVLPAGGGEPGQAYVTWVKAIHAGNLEQLKRLVPPEMAARLAGDEGKEGLEMMQAMTPTQVRVLSGSSDGATAILKVEGQMDGEKVAGEVTLERHGDHWLPTKSSW